MAWTVEDAPQSWKNQSQEVVEKGIEILNALSADMEPGRAIPIALSQAQRTVEGDGPADLWVIPHDDGWAVKKEGQDGPLEVYVTQKEAIDEAVVIAKREASTVTVQGQDGQIRDRQSFRSRL